MWHTIISESVFAGIVLKILGGTTFELPLNLLQLSTAIAGGSCSAERSCSAEKSSSSCGHMYKDSGCPCAEMGTMLRNMLIWEADTWVASSPALGMFSRIARACPFLDGENSI